MEHKKITSVLLLIAYLVGGTPLAALAAPALTPPKELLPTGVADIPALRNEILTIANWVFSFLLAVAVIYVLIGAFGYLTSGGDAEAQTKARTRIVYGLVGVGVGTLAFALVNIVTKYFGSTGVIGP